ncbi:hypothetical protein K523DRAFT_300480 [Schizophyllum commune Tattone D]|nr:hypothetical protein K523DRAFT_300480 [Schizophyllum commune Tattone D]
MCPLSPAVASQVANHRRCCSQDQERIGLQRLPYDVLLHIASFLDVGGLTSLGLTCQPLHNFCSTRPVYRRFANDLLRRCRALPLKGFQRVSDLTTSQLIRSVQQAAHYESAWRVRGPRPIGGGRASSPAAAALNLRGERAWFTVVSTPPGEEIDWLSPITSSYTLCATKSGKVVCWDVRSDTCLAEWIPEEKWELWKCRVEFEQQSVYFTMARLLSGTHEDDRVMEFILMRLDFSEAPSGDPTVPPAFRHVSKFRTMGVVMNVFLLDPPGRLLSAFIYIARTNNIGLYVILDWDKEEYVFIDTGIECDMSSNWSCILFERNVVIHSEDSDTAHQHFYPISLLQTHSRHMSSTPQVIGDLKPALTISKNFTFPAPDFFAEPPTTSDEAPETDDAHPAEDLQLSDPSNDQPPPHSTSASRHRRAHNPFPFPHWYPESVHFVRQWWPSVPGIPRVSCTVCLLVSQDMYGRARFVLAQHYFRVPMCPVRLAGPRDSDDEEEQPTDAGADAATSSRTEAVKAAERRKRAMANWHPRQGEVDPNAGKTGQREEGEDAPMQMWYVSSPFDVVCVAESDDETQLPGSERQRPLVAVDFGHAVWLEYIEPEKEVQVHDVEVLDAEIDADLEAAAAIFQDDVDNAPEDPAGVEPPIGPVGGLEAKRLRFVTFPLFDDGPDAKDDLRLAEGQVRTLEVPKELDLNDVETINIDQSQGAVVLSVREGKIFILCYE